MRSYCVPSKIRVINIITTLFYIFSFRNIYVNHLCGNLSYLGYKVDNQDFYAILLTNVLLFIPILFYKARPKVSDVFSIVIYVMIYVPTLIAIQYYYKDYSFVLPFQLMYFFAMILYFSASSNHISYQKFRISRNTITLSPFIVLGIIAIIGTFIFFRGNIQLVSFSDVYDLRAESNDVIADSIPFFGHLYMWMSNALCPLFVALGLLLHKKEYICFGFFMAILYYMTCGMKGATIIPLLAFFFYKGLDNVDNMKYTYPILTSGLLFGYLLLLLFPDSEVAGLVVSILLMRTYGIASLLTPIYIDVFQNHPYTYYCHVGIINKIFGLYPFDNPSMGNAVAEAFDGYDKESNLNTNFMVTDGIAAGGLVGIFIITVVFYYFLCYLNKFSNNYRFNFVVASMSGIMMALSNVSFFTTIMSCGLILLLFFLRFVKFKTQ